jgi:4-aminobutyrate aminotransferase-like enzyme
LRQLDRFLKQNQPTYGAVLFEPVQGRGGIRVLSPDFLRAMRQITRRYGVLLIADEIMTGLGRTGRTFAVEHAGITPDLLCVGKTLANGFPLSACIGTPEVMAAWPPSDGEAIHTSTFLGNPLGCAMALASLKEHAQGHWTMQAANLGREWKHELQNELSAHPHVGEVRGIGLMLGIVVVKDKKSLAPDPVRAGALVKTCLQMGLVVLSGGRYRNVLTLTPPLTIKAEELRLATRRLKEVFYGTSSAGD